MGRRKHNTAACFGQKMNERDAQAHTAICYCAGHCLSLTSPVVDYPGAREGAEGAAGAARGVYLLHWPEVPTSPLMFSHQRALLAVRREITW